MTAPRARVRIENAFGVAHPYGDTHHLAELAGRADRPGKALDLGTGTGYVAIDLALRGWEVDAVDVSPRALALARRNAALNGVSIRVLCSSWFDAVEGPYDVIACNPPMRGDETERTRLVTATLRWAPRLAHLLHRITQPWFERRRVDFLASLARSARPHLAPGGRLLLVISPFEAAALPGRVDGLVHVGSSRPPRKNDAPPNLDVVTFVFQNPRSPAYDPESEPRP